MSATVTITHRPQRWDQPFCDPTAPMDVRGLLQQPLFASMKPDDFPKQIPLEGILRNDARVVDFEDGDIIIREGDYGSSAFLILSGSVGVVLKSLPSRMLGRQERRQRSLMESVREWWQRSPVVESRATVGAADQNEVASRRGRDGQVRVYLQDIPRILAPNEIESMGAGELFGEMAALTRSPRSATVIAQGRCRLLEIRWQGLRDLMKYSPRLRQYTAQQYREHSLKVHLRETPLLHGLDERAVDALAQNVQFQSFGDFEWHQPFREVIRQDVNRQIESEPVIAIEGEYVGGLYMIRSGFVRVSRRRGDGHHTLTYLGKGDYFGFSEVLRYANSGTSVPWQHSFRAIGYVDLLQIPTSDVIQYVLPNWPNPKQAAKRGREIAASVVETLPDQTRPKSPFVDPTINLYEPWARSAVPIHEASPEHQQRLEQFVQRRLINGEQAMLIDLDRCTRCDDCVRACADTHQGNPRFMRTGPVVGHHMVANACMHCTDPVCLIGCPTGAIGREHSTGVVQINDNTCIGCGTCSQSCPYENIRMVEIFDNQFRQQVDERQLPILKATKCDLCVDYASGPACQNACPHDALIRINMRETDVLSQWLDR
ncbi:MAG: cyclic nucleotide-binding domain-containing protein [Planctomycetaceae bacterium]|nr:cyclic nucleotide-binding domain-containing protein [Planctomycetaceae bacterium]